MKKIAVVLMMGFGLGSAAYVCAEEGASQDISSAMEHHERLDQNHQNLELSSSYEQDHALLGAGSGDDIDTVNEAYLVNDNDSEADKGLASLKDDVLMTQ
jgi:hypothetical protein